MKAVYIGNLYRFGYDLEVAGRTEWEVREALSEEYKKTYCKRDSFQSREEMEQDEEFKALYPVAMEDMEVRRMVFGEVEWR